MLVGHRAPVESANSMDAGLLATGIEKMDGVGGLAGWRWIFILEGLITVLFAVIAALFLPADIGSASFFTEEEREFACESAITL